MNILIVDDEALAITRLEYLLKDVQGFNVIGSARNHECAVSKIIKLKPDIVLIDVEIGNTTGFEIIDEVDKTGFRPKYIIITAFGHYAVKGIRTRVDDYLLKPVDLGELKASIERVSKKKLSAEITEKIIRAKLTKREEQIINGLIDGKKSREIADQLYLSVNTVDTFRRKLLKKFNVTNTLELVISFLK